MFAGYLEKSARGIPFAWSMTFLLLSGLFLAVFVYHTFVLPHPKSDRRAATLSASSLWREFLLTFRSFFQKEGIGVALGFTQGTVGIIGLTIGGILGGIAVSRHGLKHWLWPMVWAISLPDLVYVYLSYFPETSLLWVNVCIFVEQFGYGFGFTAYMMYLIYFSRGTHSTAHYAICTAFMALGMMLPGMAAGWLQEQLGYQKK